MANNLNASDKTTAVLETPPVKDALTAVRVSIVAAAKKGIQKH